MAAMASPTVAMLASRTPPNAMRAALAATICVCATASSRLILLDLLRIFCLNAGSK